MIQSIKRFITYASQIEKFTRQVNISDDTVNDFKKRTEAASRIYVTGTGTSLPTALYLTTKLQSTYNKSVIFLPTAKMIRHIPELETSDLIIIISHGFNRADARIIYDGAVAKTDTIVISGKIDAEVSDSTLLITVPPAEEKIFCRPISPVTTLAAIHRLFEGNTVTDLPIMDEAEALSAWINPKKQIILLYAADVSFGAELWNIVLREGAGLNVLIKDIENYAHGYYGVDTADLKNRQFIILTSDSKEDLKDIDRASGLYGIKDFDKYMVTIKGDIFTANLTLFASAPEIVKNIILLTGRDMDSPNGMEENRKYHEYDRYQNYI